MIKAIITLKNNNVVSWDTENTVEQELDRIGKEVGTIGYVTAKSDRGIMLVSASEIGIIQLEKIEDGEQG